VRFLRTLAALALVWLAWWSGGWMQEKAGLEWLGLIWPAACVMLACGLFARLLDRH